MKYLAHFNLAFDHEFICILVNDIDFICDVQEKINEIRKPYISSNVIGPNK